MIKTSAERIPKTEEPRKHQTAAFPGIITIAVLQLHRASSVKPCPLISSQESRFPYNSFHPSFPRDICPACHTFQHNILPQIHNPAMPEAIRRISLHSHPAALSFSCPDITCFLLSEPDPEDMFPALFFLHFSPDYATLFLH